ncbi:hypothetical protein EC988_003549 [Linderina pennispora]|nr:hypothetical protein EC988_003549 [Linderina pennispora]
MSAVHESVQSDLVHAGESASPSASSVFALLSGNKIESACLSAISHRDYRLATLVSQCGSGAVGGGGSDTQFQEFVRTQLHRLEEVGDSKTFPSSYRRVYELLSGNVEWEASQLPRSSSSGCFVSRGLDWKRAFGVTLWYAQAPADPIAGAVRQYERMFKEGSLSSGTAVPSPIAPPLPSWLFADGGLSQRTSALAEFEQADSHLAKRAAALSRSSVWDAAFQLLKLFSEPTMPLEKALVSESFTAARGDSRLATIVAWLLNAVRQCRGFEDARQVAGGKLISLAYDSMLAGWAFQLETLGLWQWSCYLLLQLSSDLHKTHAIRALLDRSLTSSSPSSALVPAAASGLLPESSLGAGDVGSIEQQVRFVRNDLHLPELWLYESYANRSRYDRQLIEAHSGTQQLAFLTGRRAQTSSPAVVAAPPLFNPGIFAGSQLAQFASPLATVALDSAAVAVLREVAWLISAHRLSSAHLLVMQKIAPDAVLRGDYRLLSKVLSYLDPAVTSPDGSGTCVPGESWMCGGQVYKSFLAAVEDLPAILKQLAAAKQIDEQSSTVQQLAEQVKQIYSQMATLLSSLPSLSARFEAFSKSMDASLGFYDGTEVFWYSAREARELRIKYSVAISEMAAVVTGQVQQLESCFPGLVSSSSSSSHASPLHQQTAIPAMLPLAEDMRILRTYQMAQTCFESLVADELEA